MWCAFNCSLSIGLDYISSLSSSLPVEQIYSAVLIVTPCAKNGHEVFVRHAVINAFNVSGKVVK
jgi:hypothetical protein